MSGEREDRGENAPADDPVFVVHIDAMDCMKPALEWAFRGRCTVIGMDMAVEMRANAAEAAMAELHARGVAILKAEMGTIDGLRIRSVPFDEFMKPAPPKWPKSMAQANSRYDGTAQWKLEKSRYRFRR